MEALREKSFVWQKFYTNVRRGALSIDWLHKDSEGLPEDFEPRSLPMVPTAEWIKTETEALAIMLPTWVRFQRGACIMAMLRSMLSDEFLLPSITSYLTTYSYSSVVTRDLFEFLDKPAKKLGAIPFDSHLRDFMEPWVNRSGYPIVYLVRNTTSNTVWIMEIINTYICNC